jgi:hypothetical protein
VWDLADIINAESVVSCPKYEVVEHGHFPDIKEQLE